MAEERRAGARTRRGEAAAPKGEGSDLAWRILLDDACPGPVNMARDHALALSAVAGAGTVRFYRWDCAALSFGRNEPVTVAYRRLLRERPSLEAVRRPTGGRAVIHDGELTYSVVAPLRALGSLRDAYRRINEGLSDGLRRLGVDARCADERADGGIGGPAAGPCFFEAASGEIVVDGCKLAGSAQARMGAAMLQHGSILLAADQSALLGRKANGGRARFVTMADVLEAPPSWGRMTDALAQGLERRLGGAWSRGAWSEGELALAARLEDRYRSPEWTWRRAH